MKTQKKQRAMRDQDPPKQCPKQGRDSCTNGRRTCTDDLNGCLYCYWHGSTSFINRNC